MSRFSFPRYPNGWFQMAWSDEIAVGDVRRLSGFCKELVAFRGKSGRLCVLDAYCPHLGAHLGVGGTVEGDTIQCPFHGWRFDGNGVCVDVPYAKCIPANSGLTRWPVVERNGLVMVWHHALGALPPLLGNAPAELVDGLGVLDRDLLVVLRAARILPPEVWERLSAAAAAQA